MFRIRELVWVSIVLVFAALGWIAAQQYHWGAGEVSNSAIYRPDSKRYSVAALSDDWSAFQIPANSVAIRVLANAAIETDAATTSMNEMKTGKTIGHPEFSYAIEFELLDKNSKLLRHGTYHFRSKLSQRIDRETGEHYFPMCLADSKSVVSQTRSLHLLLNEDLKSARQFRLRRANCDEAVTDILARTICRSSRQGHTDFGAWRHVSESRKQQLARHSVYDHQMLDQESRHSLLKWQWSRAVPQGRYQQRRLYTIGSVDDAEVATKQIPQGTCLGHGRKIVLPLGDQPVTLRIGASPVDDATDLSGNIDVTWIDPQTLQQRIVSAALNANSGERCNTVEIENVVGLVQLQSEFPAALRFWTRNLDPNEAQPWTEVEFQPKRICTYLADQRPVTFPISHVDDEMTPLKVTMRAIVDQPSEAAAQAAPAIVESTIKWRMIDENENVTKQGTRKLQAPISAFERIEASDIVDGLGDTKTVTPSSLSDPMSLWFSLPPDIKRIELMSDEDRFLVNAYVRTERIVAETQVPEDYQLANDSTPQRRWFTLRPDKEQQHANQNRMLALRVQPRLEELADEIPAEHNPTWQRLLPSGDWIATRLFVPVLDPMESQLEAKPDSEWLWHEIESDHQTGFSLINRTKQYRTIQFAFTSSQPAGTITISCDGEAVSKRSFTSSRGEFSVTLPKTSGSITARFNSQVRLFANGIDTELPASRAYYRRSAMRINGSSTSFEFEKTTSEDENVTLTLFRDQSETERAAIKVNIIPQGLTDAALEAQSDYTIRERSFDIRPQTTAKSIMVDRPGTLDQGSHCFIKLGSDLPPGKYSIEVQREDSTQGLLLMYQMVESSKPVRKILIHDNPNSL